MSFKEIILDTETTGLDVRDGHRVVEIGCIEIENFVPTKNIFHCYLNPERKVSEQAFKVHGYSDEFLAKQKKFSEIAEEFLEFINGKKLVIHNAKFDITHLNNELGLINKNRIDIKAVIDTLEIAKNKFPGAQISLDALCKRYKIDNSRREKHTAIIDCELLSKVYVNLLDQKEPVLNFNDFDQSKFNKNYNEKNISYCKKILKPTTEEKEAHKLFIQKNLKKNYF